MINHIKITNKIKPYKKKINVSSDKSISIRCILLASQAIGQSRIYNLLESDDVINTLNTIRKLGIKYKKLKNYYTINGYGIDGYETKKRISINAGNSGTLARLILGLLANSKNNVTLNGDKSLSKRDFRRIINPLREFGVVIFSKKGGLPVTISGSKFLRPINYTEELGSAQCKSSVMLAAIKTPGITKIKAKKSRDHTELLFKYLKIPMKISKGKNYDNIEITGPCNFNSFNYKVPGDISSCSFFLVLTILADKSQIEIKDININQSRTGIIKILNKMNAKIYFKNKRNYNGELIGDILVSSNIDLKGINCPKSLNSSAIDEFLIIFLVAAKSKGISIFRDLGELNKKESPRLEIALNFLQMIGVKYSRNENDIKIYGNPKLTLKGNYVMKNFMKDHRIFMMACIAALSFGGNWKIHDKDSIKTSFPDFLKKIKALGAKIN